MGEHHGSHHSYSNQFVSFFCSCESFIFWHEQTCRGISRCIGKRETKPSSLRGEHLATRMPTWTITQHVRQNIKLEATPSAKTSVSKILKESTQRRQEPQARDNWKLEEHQAPGDRLRQKICQVERKFIFVRILMENSTSRSSTIPQRI